MKFSNLSFTKQFYITILSIVSIIMFSVFSFNIYSVYEYKKESYVQEGIMQTALIADGTLAPLMFFDQEGIQANLQQLKVYENILQVVIYDDKRHVFARLNPYNRELPIYKDGKLPFLLDSEKCLVLKKNIAVNNIVYGTLYLEKDTSGLSVFLINAFKNIVIFSILLIVLIFFIVTRLSKRLISPIVELSEKLSELSKSQKYDTRLAYSSKNEVGKLYNAFNELFISIGIHQKSRDQALAKATSSQEKLEKLAQELEQRVKDRTQELEDSLKTLQMAQKQIVESEKMAALGSLVSGVAHEVNTPLGNAVTGSSIISREVNLLIEMMNSQSLKKSVLENKLQHIHETSRLLFKSVNTAANLVKSFKKISIDQTIENKREFDLHEYVEDVVATFHTKLKHIPVKVNVFPNEPLVINSYPGSFAQLLNNFIQNSIIHGFDGFDGEAEITIELSIEDKFLYLVYSDNGNGIQEDIKQKAFEPFVTTKRNAGGTGLGLNIVYNIVVQKLLGTIILKSQHGEGTVFSIKVPLN